MKNFWWSLRRELWENRSITVAPIIVAGIFLFGFAVSGLRPRHLRATLALDPNTQYGAIAGPYDMISGALMVTVMIVALFYSVDALYGERRDRSTLFWKSLPVSDRVAVLAKASVAIVILPLLAFVVTFAAHLAMMLLSSAVVAASGMSVGALWSHLSFFRMEALLLYHLIAMHSLWYAPLYGWLLLVSAWARRAPFVWALVPPFAIAYLEKLAFGSQWIANVLQHRVAGGMGASFPKGAFPTHPMTHLMFGEYLTDPGLWIGFALTALFLWGATRLRRSRGPI